jgi:hypothetical protein
MRRNKLGSRKVAPYEVDYHLKHTVGNHFVLPENKITCGIFKVPFELKALAKLIEVVPKRVAEK